MNDSSKDELFIDLGDIYLRALQEMDVEGKWHSWFNDEEVTRFQNKRIFPNTREKQRDYLEHLRKSKSDVVFAIVHKDNDVHIGNIGLHDIDPIHRRAEIGIVLGEKDFWGKGYGTKCISAVKKYAFDTLNMHRLTALILDGNSGSLKCFLKEGFIQEGTLNDYVFKNGSYLDGHVVGIINS